MSNNKSILLIDPTFNPAIANICNLLVKVGLDSFSYAIINKETNAVIAVYNEQECEEGIIKFAERLKTDAYLSLPFREVKVAVYTPNTIAIPIELYSQESLAANAQYFTAPHNANLHYHTETHFGFTTIFALQKKTDELVNFTNAKKYQENAGLLILAQSITESGLILDFTVGSFQALYLNNNQVIFQQCYEIDNTEEFNYYLLLMINQLHISSSTAIYLAGIIDLNEEKYSCIGKYFTAINFITVSSNLNQQVLDDMPAHYYSSLLALNQCV